VTRTAAMIRCSKGARSNGSMSIPNDAGSRIFEGKFVQRARQPRIGLFIAGLAVGVQPHGRSLSSFARDCYNAGSGADPK